MSEECPVFGCGFDLVNGKCPVVTAGPMASLTVSVRATLAHVRHETRSEAILILCRSIERREDEEGRAYGIKDAQVALRQMQALRDKVLP